MFCWEPIEPDVKEPDFRKVSCRYKTVHSGINRGSHFSSVAFFFFYYSDLFCSFFYLVPKLFNFFGVMGAFNELN